VRGYRYDLRQFLRWFNHTKGPPARFEKLSAIDLINYRQHLLKVEGLRPATVNRRLEALRRFCRWAQQSKRVKANVALDLRPVRTVRNTRPVGLSEPEVHTLLRLAGESSHGLATRNYALVQLMVQAGLRVGDLDTRSGAGATEALLRGAGRRACSSRPRPTHSTNPLHLQRHPLESHARRRGLLARPLMFAPVLAASVQRLAFRLYLEAGDFRAFAESPAKPRPATYPCSSRRRLHRRAVALRFRNPRLPVPSLHGCSWR
jgi:hypothetical protein